ncbi:PAP2 superfamily-domain-containing protein [Xylariomycetidae sp. FL2044]|nr:PAP2 superfamily-domain-containing protein [Xylariomycetidae sp. FL2044]
MPEDNRRRNPVLKAISPLFSPAHSYSKMSGSHSSPHSNSPTNKLPFVVIGSYVLDWIILIAVGVVGVVLGEITPNKRHFSLQDPNISFPFTEHETVNSKLLLVCNAAIPIAVILIVTLVFVPGPTVPKGTPKSLIWRRKLWELHIGWLGLALSLVAAWIITSGMKNLFGKPRPDMLSRCEPAFDRWREFIAGFEWPDDNGVQNAVVYNGQLVRADICQTTDHEKLDDGFRSYPSGHSSSAAAGLIYLSFFLASKFAITLPFVPQSAQSQDTSSVTAFPSRLRNGADPIGGISKSRNMDYESVRRQAYTTSEDYSSPSTLDAAKGVGAYNTAVQAVRRQAASPPLYLLLLTILPFFLAIFIAGSRWSDFRHHGFDILFGFIIGTICAWFAFRFYHLPIRSGAGWAWGPRSHDKAFWAGLGSWSYASNRRHWERPGDEEERITGHPPTDIEMGIRQRNAAAPARSASHDNMTIDRSESSRAIIEPEHEGRAF